MPACLRTIWVESITEERCEAEMPEDAADAPISVIDPRMVAATAEFCSDSHCPLARVWYLGLCEARRHGLDAE